ncbi:hypothetical protein TcasGA2_TC032752 [Tribolium castaneum]|uniref:Uncharacterized protein n=1 Tax=Tribolium castaneum TaxID=7070 RepID=A0A139WJ00_TRICA|nr:hypothetical protein TcasGA2_TC032752 [Tribolium castaneum]
MEGKSEDSSSMISDDENARFAVCFCDVPAVARYSIWHRGDVRATIDQQPEAGTTDAGHTTLEFLSAV